MYDSLSPASNSQASRTNMQSPKMLSPRKYVPGSSSRKPSVTVAYFSRAQNFATLLEAGRASEERCAADKCIRRQGNTGSGVGCAGKGGQCRHMGGQVWECARWRFCDITPSGLSQCAGSRGLACAGTLEPLEICHHDKNIPIHAHTHLLARCSTARLWVAQQSSGAHVGRVGNVRPCN